MPRNAFAQDPGPSPKSTVVALLLAMLNVFGLAGMHRFYVGKHGTGFLYLVTFGFLGIGTVVDEVMMILGRFTDAQGRRLPARIPQLNKR